MATKVQLLFQQASNKSGEVTRVRVAGWQETLYNDQGIANVRDIMRRTCELRATLLPDSAAIVGQRYSTVGLFGSSTDALFYPGSAARKADVPQMALLCVGSAIGWPNTRRFRIGGIPDAMVEEGEFNPTRAYGIALHNYFGYLVNRWGFRGRNISFASPNVLSISVAGLVVLDADLPGAAPGMKVQLLRVYNPDGLPIKGTFVISDQNFVDPSHFQFIDWGARTGSRTVLNRGRVREKGMQQFVFGNIEESRIVTHKVGRPFDQYRGRQSKRR